MAGRLFKKAKVGSYERRKAKWGYVFILPWFAYFCVFTAYPFLFGIAVSFTDYSLRGISAVGFFNFERISRDPAFFRSLRATFIYVVMYIPGCLGLSLAVANTLRHWGGKVNAVVKAIAYIPGVTSTVALTLSLRFIFHPSLGIATAFFKLIGISHFSLFDSVFTSMPVLGLILVFVNIGQPIILYSAAMNSIPVTYYEAAEIDGASGRTQFWRITLPLLHQTTTFIMITCTIGMLQVFVIPYLMTGGGPQYRTSSLLMMVYTAAFQNNNFGYASAVGVVLFGIAVVVAAFMFRIMKRDIIEY
jgi:multiple sugar transport system permease protein